MKKLTIFAMSLIMLTLALSAMQETVLFEAQHGSEKEEFKIYREFWPEPPGPIDTDENGNFYICDLDNKRIQIFSNKGIYIDEIDGLTGYNGFIKYSNNKIYFSGIDSLGYSIKCVNLVDKSATTYKKLYYKNSINPIIKQFRYDAVLYLVSNDVRNLMSDSAVGISIVSKPQYDTIMFKTTENIKMEGFSVGLSTIIGNSPTALYVFSYLHTIEKGHDVYKPRLIKQSNNQTFVYPEKDWFGVLNNKIANFIVTENNELYAFIPLCEKHVKSNDYMSNIKNISFKLIKIEY